MLPGSAEGGSDLCSRRLRECDLVPAKMPVNTLLLSNVPPADSDPSDVPSTPGVLEEETRPNLSRRIAELVGDGAELQVKVIVLGVELNLLISVAFRQYICCWEDERGPNFQFDFVSVRQCTLQQLHCAARLLKSCPDSRGQLEPLPLCPNGCTTFMKCAHKAQVLCLAASNIACCRQC